MSYVEVSARPRQFGIRELLLVTCGVALSLCFLRLGMQHRQTDLSIARNYIQMGVFCFAGTTGAFAIHLWRRHFQVVVVGFMISGYSGMIVAHLLRQFST